MCYNALDRHVSNGKADVCAVIYDSSVLKKVVKYTYSDMLTKVRMAERLARPSAMVRTHRLQVQSVAGMLRHLGVKKGDRVLVYMPMIPETMMTMLACARCATLFSQNTLASNKRNKSTPTESAPRMWSSSEASPPRSCRCALITPG